MMRQPLKKGGRCKLRPDKESWAFLGVTPEVQEQQTHTPGLAAG